MTYIAATSYIAAAPSLDARPVSSPIGLVKAWIVAAHRRRQERHAYAHLLQLDPHLLKDVGVTATDLHAAIRRTYEA